MNHVGIAHFKQIYPSDPIIHIVQLAQVNVILNFEVYQVVTAHMMVGFDSPQSLLWIDRLEPATHAVVQTLLLGLFSSFLLVDRARVGLDRSEVQRLTELVPVVQVGLTHVTLHFLITPDTLVFIIIIY